MFINICLHYLLLLITSPKLLTGYSFQTSPCIRDCTTLHQRCCLALWHPSGHCVWPPNPVHFTSLANSALHGTNWRESVFWFSSSDWRNWMSLCASTNQFTLAPSWPGQSMPTIPWLHQEPDHLPSSSLSDTSFHSFHLLKVRFLFPQTNAIFVGAAAFWKLPMLPC